MGASDSPSVVPAKMSRPARFTRKYDIGAMCNGILAGLVSITGPCGAVESGSSIAIGAIGGVFMMGTSMLLKKLKIDDPLDAFAVHGACGVWGVLAAALFNMGLGFQHFNGRNGFSCMENADGTCNDSAWGGVFAANVMEIISISAWVGTLTAMVMLPLHKAGHLRIADDEEEPEPKVVEPEVRKGVDV